MKATILSLLLVTMAANPLLAENPKPAAQMKPPAMEDPLADVPGVPIIPVNSKIKVPNNAVRVWGSDLNCSLVPLLKAKKSVKLKYCYSKPVDPKTNSGHEFIYLIDPADQKFLSCKSAK